MLVIIGIGILHNEQVALSAVCTRLPSARADVPLFRISETAGQIALKLGMVRDTFTHFSLG